MRAGYVSGRTVSAPPSVFRQVLESEILSPIRAALRDLRIARTEANLSVETVGFLISGTGPKEVDQLALDAAVRMKEKWHMIFPVYAQARFDSAQYTKELH
jgi:hypothetical protein